ncbi:MAG: serine acetyltransferase [Deltaproteobacteria bacterium]|nr:serine acetyltransferase [Deltaproteobacteria bacterium]
MRSAEETHEPVPSRDGVVHLVEALRAVLFPGYFGTAEARPATLRYHLGYTLDRVQRNLRLQVRRGLAFSCQEPYDPKRCDERAQEVTHTFLARLPEVQRLLGLDVEAAFQGDPAAPSPAEIIFCYPGLLAITNYRIAHELQRLGVPLLPRMIAEHAHSITGIDIHPGATIGERFFIDHGTGVVIGETAVIGERVRLYQGVTLGAKSFPADEKGHLVKGIPRHPIIEDDVIIYAGATVLGRITVGRGTVVGGNVWLTRSVPPGSRVAMQAPRDSSFESGDGI